MDSKINHPEKPRPANKFPGKGEMLEIEEMKFKITYSDKQRLIFYARQIVEAEK